MSPETEGSRGSTATATSASKLSKMEVASFSHLPRLSSEMKSPFPALKIFRNPWGIFNQRHSHHTFNILLPRSFHLNVVTDQSSLLNAHMSITSYPPKIHRRRGNFYKRSFVNCIRVLAQVVTIGASPRNAWPQYTAATSCMEHHPDLHSFFQSSRSVASSTLPLSSWRIKVSETRAQLISSICRKSWLLAQLHWRNSRRRQ